MNLTDLRLKIRHFFRKYKMVILIGILIWLIIFAFNQMMKLRTKPEVKTTTYTPTVSVMDSSSKVPKQVASEIDLKIKQYVEYCNNNEFDKAYNMLSDECKKYAYNSNFEQFQRHVIKLMPTPKKYSIQDYSNERNRYIYSVRYFEDYINTGLTNSSYGYTEEKMVFTKIGDELSMTVGDFVDYKTYDDASLETDYIRVEVLNNIVSYDNEKYTVKFINKSDNYIAICDSQVNNEVTISLKNEIRKPENIEYVVLNPKQEKEVTFEFIKYYDDNDKVSSLNFNSVRVLKRYYDLSSTQEEIEQAITNAIANESVQVYVQ